MTQDTSHQSRREGRRFDLFDLTVMGLLGLMSLICLYPFLSVLAYAFSDPSKMIGRMVTFYPIGFDFHGFLGLVTRPVIQRSMLVTLLVTIAGTGISLLITGISAYITSREQLPGRVFFSWMVLLPLYVSAGMIPTFMIIKTLGLYNSYAALILPIAVSEFNFILMRSFFRDFPAELEDAARIDGANLLQLLCHVVIPLSLPAFATIGLFYAVDYWNDYMQALLYIGDPDKYTLQLRLRSLMGSSRMTSLCVLVSCIPILMGYPWIQRFFVKGMLLGSVKG